MIRLAAAGLEDATGRRKVGNQLKCMGQDGVRIYDTFEWAAAIPDDPNHNAPAVPAEDRHNLDTVFSKFGRHFGVQWYRSLKRQESLDSRRKPKQKIMDYIAELKGTDRSV